MSVANVRSDPSHLGALATMVLEGRLRAAIRRTYPLEDAAQALADLTNGGLARCSSAIRLL